MYLKEKISNIVNSSVWIYMYSFVYTSVYNSVKGSEANSKANSVYNSVLNSIIPSIQDPTYSKLQEYEFKKFRNENLS